MKKLLVTLAILAVASAPSFAANKDIQDKSQYCSVAACMTFGWFCC